MYKRKARNPRFVRDWPLIVAHYGNACIHCKSKEIASDHVIPLVPGREDLNCLANLQPLCRKCNSGKSGLAHDYRPDKGLWILQTFKEAREPFMSLDNLIKYMQARKPFFDVSAFTQAT